MQTIQGFKVSDRLEAGQTVIEAAKVVATRPIKKRLSEFVSRHRSFVAAQKLVEQAEHKLHEARDNLGTLDALQDEAVDALAVALIAQGEPRMRPFKRFKAPPPSTLRVLGDVAEAKIALSLVSTVRHTKPREAKTIAALNALEKASKAVLAASKPIERCTEELTRAIYAREGIAQGWSNAFAALKRAARSADDDGAARLYETLFVRVTKKPRRKKTATPTPPAA